MCCCSTTTLIVANMQHTLSSLASYFSELLVCLHTKQTLFSLFVQRWILKRFRKEETFYKDEFQWGDSDREWMVHIITCSFEHDIRATYRYWNANFVKNNFSWRNFYFCTYFVSCSCCCYLCFPFSNIFWKVIHFFWKYFIWYIFIFNLTYLLVT